MLGAISNLWYFLCNNFIGLFFIRIRACWHLFVYHLWELTYPNFLNSSQNFKQHWTCIKTDAWICGTHQETIEIHGFANSFYLSLTKVLGTQGGEKWISSEISLGRDIIQMQEDEIWSYCQAQIKPSFTHCSSEKHTTHLESDEVRASLFFKKWDEDEMMVTWIHLAWLPCQAQAQPTPRSTPGI